MREVGCTVPAPQDLGLELIGVPAGSDLALELRLEWVSEGVLVSGTVSGHVEGECGRCLRAISRPVAVTLQELFVYPDSTTDVTTEEDEVSRLRDDMVDLEPAVRDTLVPALPVHPLCREDCPGLCPECGVHWDELPADHDHEQLDPRWAALSKLTGPKRRE